MGKFAPLRRSLIAASAALFFTAACSMPEPGDINLTVVLPDDTAPEEGANTVDEPTDPDTTDTDVAEPADTAAPEIEDIQEVVHWDYRWDDRLGTANTQIDPSVESVYLGTFDLTYEGDEPVWTRDLVLPVWARVGAVGSFGQGNYRSFFNQCELRVDGTVFATGGIQDAEELSFDSVYLTVTESMSFDVFCNATNSGLDFQLQFAIDVPEDDVEFTNEVDGDEVEVEVGDRNGGAYPSYWVQMPYDEYAHCTHTRWSGNQEFETTVDPIVVWDAVPQWMSPLTQAVRWDFRVIADGCNPDFEVDFVEIHISEDNELVSFVPEGGYADMTASWQLDGANVYSAFAHRQFGATAGFNSNVVWRVTSPRVGGGGTATGTLPANGGLIGRFSPDENMFHTFWQTHGEIPADENGRIIVEASLMVRIHDRTSGVGWTVWSTVPAITRIGY